jgi:hypothetical protein
MPHLCGTWQAFLLKERIATMPTTPEPPDARRHSRREILRSAAYVTPAVVVIGARPSLTLAASGSQQAPPTDPPGRPRDPVDPPRGDPPGDPRVPPPANPRVDPAPTTPPRTWSAEPPPVVSAPSAGVAAAPGIVSGPVLGVSQPGTLLVTALPSTGAGDGPSAGTGPDATTALLLGAAAAVAGVAVRRYGTANADAPDAPANE